jgi:hypothetical protein
VIWLLRVLVRRAFGTRASLIVHSHTYEIRNSDGETLVTWPRSETLAWAVWLAKAPRGARA